MKQADIGGLAQFVGPCVTTLCTRLTIMDLSIIRALEIIC